MTKQTIGRYQIIKELGKGGMATVYLAHDPNPGRDGRNVALKVIHPSSEHDSQYLQRFQREIDTIIGLGHSAIVPIYDAYFPELDDDERPYLVMQYLSKGSLAKRLEQQGALSELQTAQIITRITSALNVVHLQGIIHRDLKPANILFNEHDEAYLVDFGIVKLLQDVGPSLTKNQAIGTPAYMSPEQLRGEEVGAQTDIYAMGIILFEMLTGQSPEVFYRDKTTGIPPSVEEFNPSLTESFAYDEIIRKATARDPNARYQKANHLAKVVNAAAHSWSDYQRMEEAIANDLGDTNFTESTAPRTPTRERPLPGSTQKSIVPPATIATSHKKRNLVIGLSFLLFIIAFLVVGQFFNNPQPTINETPNALTATTPIPVSNTSPESVVLPSRNDVQRIMVLDQADSAVWQVNEEIARIPDDGLIPITPDESVLIQSSSEPIEIALPNRDSLFLDLNTIVNLHLRAGETAEVVDIQLQQGRILLETAVNPSHIATELGNMTLKNRGSMGVEINTNDSQLIIDCLTGSCILEPVNTTQTIELDAGRSAIIENNGSTTTYDTVRSDLFTSLISQIPTATPIPTDKPTNIHTPTPASLTASPTLTPITLTFTTQPQEIGRSVNGLPIELLQISQGSHPVLFVGGIHAGYAPNSVALLQETIGYFQSNPQEIPKDIALYVIPNLNPDSANSPGALNGRLNAKGVDLNRNWDCRWQPNNTILGEFVENSGGTEPVSEPESQALYQVIQTLKPKAVIFWGAGNRSLGIASPGACDEYSLVSAPFSVAYGQAAGLNYVDNTLVEADPNLHGDVTNWLDKQGIPAIFVILSRFSDYNWQQELAGMQTTFATVLGTTQGDTTIPPAETACTITANNRWQTLWRTHQNKLGCATSNPTSPLGAYQSFDQGMMVWRQDLEQVYVMSKNGSLSVHTVNDPALADYYDSETLKGAFGYLWNTKSTVREQLGNPLAPEQIAADFTIQEFAQGTIFYFADNGARDYVLTFTPKKEWLNP